MFGAVGAAGTGLTITVALLVLIQPFSDEVTVYVPATLVVAFVIVGF
jgi:hypothetical protein